MNTTPVFSAAPGYGKVKVGLVLGFMGQPCAYQPTSKKNNYLMLVDKHKGYG